MELTDVLYKENRINEYLQRCINIIKDQKCVLLFGAGVGGANTKKWLENENAAADIECFLDNNRLKWGTRFANLKVLNPAERLKSYNGEFIVISCGEGDDIKKQLYTYGIPDEKIMIPDISIIDLEGRDFDYIWRHINELSQVYNMCADAKSRKVFSNILNYKISHETHLLEEIYDTDEKQYFDKQLINFNDKDIFLNCGSYIGDTIEEYVKCNQGHYDKIYCCEADEDNFNILLDTIERLGIRDVECHKIGLWKEKGKLMFHNIGSGSGYIGEGGTTSIQADTIDHMFGGVTFINMDIEGAEYEALLGGASTIRKYAPVLAISVYHKRDDFIRIPFLIKSLLPEYRIYFRHYREASVQETVLYAIK